MYTLDSTFKSEKNKSQNFPIYLYTIHLYDGINDLHLAEYDADITYDGITYTKFPIKHAGTEETSSGQIDKVTVSIANVNRLIQAYLELYDWGGLKVTITLAWSNQLSDTDANIKFVYYIDSYSASQETVEFTLTSKLDILDAQLPYGKYNRNYCRWKFKSTECGYSGSETTCNKTTQDCELNKNNILRYGGFPSIPSRRIFV